VQWSKQASRQASSLKLTRRRASSAAPLLISTPLPAERASAHTTVAGVDSTRAQGQAVTSTCNER
jgi:hypothetical protein